MSRRLSSCRTADVDLSFGRESLEPIAAAWATQLGAYHAVGEILPIPPLHITNTHPFPRKPEALNIFALCGSQQRQHRSSNCGGDTLVQLTVHSHSETPRIRCWTVHGDKPGAGMEPYSRQLLPRLRGSHAPALKVGNTQSYGGPEKTLSNIHNIS